MKTKVLIIGLGLIGNALADALLAEGKYHVALFPKTLVNTHHLDEQIARSDVVCITISTKDEGEAEFDLIMRCVRAHKKVVTAAKGALSNFFAELEPHLGLVGFSATVGGGSGVLDLVTVPGKSVRRASGVVNATLNFILHLVAQGVPSEQAFAEAKKQGFADPGAESLLELVNNECLDLRRKLAILTNLMRPKWATPIKASNASFTLFAPLEIERILALAKTHRFMVEIDQLPRPFAFGDCAYYRCGPFVARAGFTEIGNSMLAKLGVPAAEGNSLFVQYVSKQPGADWEADHREGLGAGPAPTVGAIIKDVRNLTRN